MSTNFEMDFIEDKGFPWGAPWWTPLQYKMEDERQKYAGREQLAINISDTETSARVLRNTWVYTGCVMEKKHIV